MPSSARYTAAMAADPGLAQSDMQEIAESRPDLLAALASNPALYPALREWLAGHPKSRACALQIAPSRSRSRQRYRFQPR